MKKLISLLLINTTCLAGLPPVTATGQNYGSAVPGNKINFGQVDLSGSNVINTLPQSKGGTGVTAIPTLSAYWVDKAGTNSSTCGTAVIPCLGIQQSLTNIGDAVTAADVKKPIVVFIGGGTYDEDLTMPNGRIITLVALGTVVLGNGAGSNWASTNSRSVTQTFNTAALQGSDIKPALSFVSITDADMTSTFIAESGGFYISGNLNITGDGVTNTLNTYNLKLAGNLVHTDASLTNWQSRKTLIAGTVTTTGNLVLERAYDSRFNSLVSVNAYNMVHNCNFAAGMTVQSIQQNLLPNGMFNTNFSGTFTGPASSLRLDAASNYYFVKNSAALGGSATKELISSPGAASSFMSLATGTLTSLSMNQIIGSGLAPRALTIENVVASAANFTCITNPTLTLYDCGTSAGACTAGTTALASVTLTAANTQTLGSVTSASIAAGHYWAWEVTAGSCTGLNASGSAEAVVQ